MQLLSDSRLKRYRSLKREIPIFLTLLEDRILKFHMFATLHNIKAYVCTTNQGVRAGQWDRPARWGCGGSGGGRGVMLRTGEPTGGTGKGEGATQPTPPQPHSPPPAAVPTLPLHSPQTPAPDSAGNLHSTAVRVELLQRKWNMALIYCHYTGRKKLNMVAFLKTHNILGKWAIKCSQEHYKQHVY